MNPINPLGIPVPITLPFLDRLLSFILKYRRIAIVITSLLGLTLLSGFFLVKRATELNPMLFGPENRSIKALILYELGVYSRAARLYRTDYVSYLSREGSTPPLLLHTLAQEFPTAIRSAEERIAEHPDDIDALLALGQVAYDQGHYPKAAQYTDRVLGVYKENVDALLLAALIATRDPSRGDPIPTLNAALRTGTAARNLTSFLNTLEITGYLLSKPAQDRPLTLLAHYYRVLRIYDGGMDRRVIHTAERAIQKGDHPADAFLSIGVIHKKAGKPYKALDAFLKSAAADPRQALAYFHASVLYEAVGDTTNQYIFLRNAFRAAPSDPFYIRAINRFFADSFDSHAVRRFMSEGLKADPNSIPAYAALATAKIRTSAKQEARAIFQHMVTLPPGGPSDLEQQAWAAEWMDRLDLQEAVLRRSLALDPKRVTPHMELARLLKKARRFEEALNEFEIAAQAGGYQNTQTIQEYCQLYSTLGKPAPVRTCTLPGRDHDSNQVAQPQHR